jgi:hypothetical protein
MRGDNAALRAFDKGMGWIDEDGSSPAAVAEREGVAGHIIGEKYGIPVVVWERGGTWSYCVLSRYTLGTTLLARSESGLLKLLLKLYERVRSEKDAKRWQPYYSVLWEKKYRKWCCTGDRSCKCQLCRMARG